MERLTKRIEQYVYYTQGKYEDTLPVEMETNDIRSVLKKLAEYEDAEEQGLLIRLPIGKDKNDLINILARLLMHTEFGNCYLCTNPMKNVTLDGKNNGCDGNCRFDEKFDEDNLITKIIEELQTKEAAKQALKRMEKE